MILTGETPKYWSKTSHSFTLSTIITTRHDEELIYRQKVYVIVLVHFIIYISAHQTVPLSLSLSLTTTTRMRQ
jgi:hypothetical protein